MLNVFLGTTERNTVIGFTEMHKISKGRNQFFSECQVLVVPSHIYSRS